MKRNSLNFWIDLVALMLMLGMVWTGLLMYYVMPSGTGGGGGGGDRLWELDRHDFGRIHFYFAVVLVGLMVLHLALHWNWFCVTLKGLLGMRLGSMSAKRYIVYGLIFLAVISAAVYGSLDWANRQVQSGSRARSGRAFSSERQVTQIIGSNTLAQAAETAGMQVEELIKQLNLPADVDRNEMLGRLGRRYGFTVTDVRRILEK